MRPLTNRCSFIYIHAIFLQELFNDASKALFKATGDRAYFRNVTILAPTSWNIDGAEPATIESFDKVLFIECSLIGQSGRYYHDY